MISKTDCAAAQRRALALFSMAGVLLRPDEAARIEVADFGLSELETTGLQLFTYVNTNRCCAKELALFPRQTCPEHWHPPSQYDEGKEETFRCRWGEVYLFVPGEPDASPLATPPASRAKHYTVFHQIRLRPGEQFTLPPNTPHWFQAGDEGAVVSEFSTPSRDELDQFRDPKVRRATNVT